MIISIMEIFDLPDIQRVISCLAGPDHAAYQMDQGAFKQGAILAPDKRNVQALLWSPSEMSREDLLVSAQHTYAVKAASGKDSMHRTFLINADQHQGWIQRNRTESMRRHTVYSAAIYRGNDRDTAGEKAQGFTIGHCVNLQIVDLHMQVLSFLLH